MGPVNLRLPFTWISPGSHLAGSYPFTRPLAASEMHGDAKFGVVDGRGLTLEGSQRSGTEAAGGRPN
jgi:hypothetical protein